MIEVRNIVKTFGEYSAVNNISFQVSPGKIFGFLGANGAGKTTTLKMLVGLSSPDKGEILIHGGNPLETQTRARIGFFPETPSFYEYLTGAEFLDFVAELSLSPKQQKETEKEKDTLLQDMGIYDARNRPIRTYSKGMRQRLGFAAAIVHNPKYVFLDEPLDGLDPLGRKHIKNIILKLKKEGKTVFFSSHILFDMEELCDEIGIIHKGKLLYAGETKKFSGGGEDKSLEEKFVEVIEQQK